VKTTEPFFGDNKAKQLHELEEHTSKFAVEIAVLLKELRRVGLDACHATESNMLVYRDIVGQISSVASADVTTAKDLVERTLALSLELQNIDSIEAKIVKLEESLSLYERIADVILNL